MILDTDTNTKETNQIGLDMLYQADIADYIKRSIVFQEKICKSYTVVWEFCKKQFQNSIKTNVE